MIQLTNEWFSGLSQRLKLLLVVCSVCSILFRFIYSSFELENGATNMTEFTTLFISRVATFTVVFFISDLFIYISKNRKKNF